MTNKKFKLAAMSLATAVAVSTVGPSASAVTYQLENGDVTVAENEKGVFSYQNTANGKTDDVYVDQDTKDNGQIIIKQAEGTTSNRQKGQQRTILSLWKKMSRTRMETVTWISSLTV